jgi:hypothetical protein
MVEPSLLIAPMEAPMRVFTSAVGRLALRTTTFLSALPVSEYIVNFQ